MSTVMSVLAVQRTGRPELFQVALVQHRAPAAAPSFPGQRSDSPTPATETEYCYGHE